MRDGVYYISRDIDLDLSDRIVILGKAGGKRRILKYILLNWFHNLEDEPYIIYSEIDNQRYETRKIEIYKNGTIRKCNEKMLNSQIELGDVAFPENLDEINQDEQFHAQYISKEEFESMWN